MVLLDTTSSELNQISESSELRPIFAILEVEVNFYSTVLAPNNIVWVPLISSDSGSQNISTSYRESSCSRSSMKMLTTTYNMFPQLCIEHSYIVLIQFYACSRLTLASFEHLSYSDIAGDIFWTVAYIS